MIARIIDLDQEREVKNSYSSGYEQGRIKGILQILALTAFLILALKFIPLWAFMVTLGYAGDFLVWSGFKLIELVKILIGFLSRIEIVIK